MVFSQSAQYALRLAAVVALHQGKSAVPGKQAASLSSVPAAYASKILRKLVESKVLQGTKGHGGGFMLSRPASRICIADILDAADAEVKPRTCVFGLNACSDRNPCALHHRWKELQESVRGWAMKTTLADVIKDNATLKLE